MLRKTLILALLLLVGACSAAERMSHQVIGSGVAYDTFKDAKTAGVYLTQGVYDTADANNGTVIPEEVLWRTLYNGLQTVQKDGYDTATATATATGPGGVALKHMVTQYGSTTTRCVWPGFAFSIHGYRSGEAAPPTARPIGQLMEDANRRAYAAMAKRNRPQ